MNHSLIPFYLILSSEIYFNDKRYRLITFKSVVHSLPESNFMYGPGQIHIIVGLIALAGVLIIMYWTHS